MGDPARRRATLADLTEHCERGLAVELIDGVIVQKAAPLPAHGSAQMKLGAILDPHHRKPGGPRGPGGWWIMSEVEVLYPPREDVYRHDVVGFRRDIHAGRPAGFPVRERPDWVCGILSASTARYDVVQKKRTLHERGVPHYWIIDPEHETLVVMRHGPEGYVDILSASPGDMVRAEPFETTAFDVGEIFGHET